MNIPTKKIALPVSGLTVEMKDWITGSEAEYIDDALFEAIKVTPDMRGRSASMSNFDVSKIKEETHRSFEKFIISIFEEGKDTKTGAEILPAILDLPEDDYEQLKKEVIARRTGKKKLQEETSNQ